jgi:hypothetical protein
MPYPRGAHEGINDTARAAAWQFMEYLERAEQLRAILDQSNVPQNNAGNTATGQEMRGATTAAPGAKPADEVIALRLAAVRVKEQSSKCQANYDHTVRFWEATSGICYRTPQTREVFEATASLQA